MSLPLSIVHSRAGNQGGSYMTIMSNGGLQFGILEIISSFGNVWADQSYWQVTFPCCPHLLQLSRASHLSN